MLNLESPTPHHLPELLAFELAHRRFFEENINARPASYYSEAGVASAIDEARRDAERDAAYQYLIRGFW